MGARASVQKRGKQVTFGGPARMSVTIPTEIPQETMYSPTHEWWKTVSGSQSGMLITPSHENSSAGYRSFHSGVLSHAIGDRVLFLSRYVGVRIRVLDVIPLKPGETVLCGVLCSPRLLNTFRAEYTVSRPCRRCGML